MTTTYNRLSGFIERAVHPRAPIIRVGYGYTRTEIERAISKTGNIDIPSLYLLHCRSIAYDYIDFAGRISDKLKMAKNLFDPKVFADLAVEGLAKYPVNRPEVAGEVLGLIYELFDVREAEYIFEKIKYRNPGLYKQMDCIQQRYAWSTFSEHFTQNLQNEVSDAIVTLISGEVIPISFFYEDTFDGVLIDGNVSRIFLERLIYPMESKLFVVRVGNDRDVNLVADVDFIKNNGRLRFLVRLRMEDIPQVNEEGRELIKFVILSTKRYLLEGGFRPSLEELNLVEAYMIASSGDEKDLEKRVSDILSMYNTARECDIDELNKRVVLDRLGVI